MTEPSKVVGQLLAAVLDPLAHVRPIGLATVFAAVLGAGYALFYSSFRPHLRRLDDR